MSTNSPQKYGPYSPTTQAGNFYFVSGQIGVDPDTKIASLDIVSQTKQAITNLKQLLATEHLDLSNVVKTNVYLTNMDDFLAMNDVYSEMFTDKKPARTTVAVKELPRVGGDIPICVEIDAMAVRL